MRINNNLTALNSYNQITKNSNAASKSMEKLSTGLAINKAADNAAGLSISEKMRSQIKGLEQSQKNSQDAVSYIQTAEGALNEVSAIAVRLKELSVQKANGTYNADDQANIDLEMDALIGEVGNIQTNTTFNGLDVFGADATFRVGDKTTQELTVSAATLTKVTGLTNASTSADIDGAIVELNTQRSTYGAAQNRLEYNMNNLTTTAENLTSAESRIRDTDMSKEVMEMTKNNILSQAAQSMLVQANQNPQNVLQLLR